MNKKDTKEITLLIIIGLLLIINIILIVLLYKTKNKFSGNRQRVYEYILSNEEDYKFSALVNLIEHNKTEESIEETEAEVETSENKTSENKTDIENYKNVSHDDVNCRFAIEPGQYIAGRDFPSGKMTIYFKSKDTGFFCKEIGGEQHIFGNFRKINDMYSYTVEIPFDSMVKLKSKAYVASIDNEKYSDDPKMKECKFENLTESELLWLARTGKKPSIKMEDIKILKAIDNNSMIVGVENMFIVEFTVNDKKVNLNKPFTAKGVINGSEQVGKKLLAIVNVGDNWVQ